MEFDIEADSKKLKEIVAKYDSDTFIGDIAQLLTLIEPPRMPYYPFQGLDSPLRQLTYIAALNLSSSPGLIEKVEVETDEEWEEIVKQIITVRAGYYEELLPKENDNDEEFYELYKTSMPVFNNYFDTGNLNFEEQEIERIISFFLPFNHTVVDATGLNVEEFITIYNLIDKQFEDQLNTPLQILRRSPSAKEIWENFKKAGTHPRDWNYQGNDPEILLLVNYFINRGARFTLKIDELHKMYAKEKINLFLRLFSLKRGDDNSYLYYTQPNKVLLRPIFCKSDQEIIIIDRKQILHAIFRHLHEILNQSNRRESYFTSRGEWLQNKTESILRNYFGKDVHISNEYKVDGKV